MKPLKIIGLNLASTTGTHCLDVVPVCRTRLACPEIASFTDGLKHHQTYSCHIPFCYFSSTDPGQQAGDGGRRGFFPGGSGSGGQRGGGSGTRQGSSLLDEQVLVTLLRLQQDVTDVLNRLGKLEVAVQEHQEVMLFVMF